MLYHFRRVFWQFNEVFTLLLLTVVLSFIGYWQIVQSYCLERSPFLYWSQIFYSVTRFNQLNMLEFKIYSSFLYAYGDWYFIAKNYFRSLFLLSVFWFLLSTPSFFLTFVVTLAPFVSPLSCSIIQ